MEKLRISVIILAYKSNKDELMTAVRSAFSQSYENTEIIIQDDGSEGFDAGETESEIRKLSPRFSFRVHKNEKNVGTVKSYNIAWRMSDGDIIVPLAADDRFFDDDVLKRIADEFSDEKVNICTAFRIGSVNGRKLPAVQDVREFQRSDSKERVFRLIFLNFISGSVLYLRRSYLEKKGGFDEDIRLLEDYPFILRAAIENEEIHFADFTSICYGEKGVSNAGMSKAYRDDHIILYNKYIIPALDSHIEKKNRKAAILNCMLLYLLEAKSEKRSAMLKAPWTTFKVFCLRKKYKNRE